MGKLSPPTPCTYGETWRRREDMFVHLSVEVRIKPGFYSNSKFVSIGCGKPRFAISLNLLILSGEIESEGY